MEPEQLRIFLAVAEQGSFTAAAKALFVSHSTTSRAVAALEHELKYKKNIANPELITQKLHRCANELASCDVSMQTLKKIIRSL